jgi:hypothetical protein
MPIKYNFETDIPSLIAVLRAACTDGVVEFENHEFSKVKLNLIQGYEDAPALDAAGLLQKAQEDQIQYFNIMSRGQNKCSFRVSQGLFKSKEYKAAIYACEIRDAFLAFKDKTHYRIALSIIPTVEKLPTSPAEEEQFKRLGGEIKESNRCAIL